MLEMFCISRVSIPFIAGQWSLPLAAWWAWREAAAFQSPSLRGSGRFRSSTPCAGPCRPCFNPLHCGAVVASNAMRRALPALSPVSIPFIAGQWSLLGGKPKRGKPKHGRSIPFIAGQWSLLGPGPSPGREGSRAQSPSLRGSGRFSPSRLGPGAGRSHAQSPSLRGSGRFSQPTHRQS